MLAPSAGETPSAVADTLGDSRLSSIWKEDRGSSWAGLILSPNDLQGERSVSMFPQRVFMTLENIWGGNFWIILLQSIWFSAINGPEIPPVFTTGFTCYCKWAHPWISWWQMVSRACKQECPPSLFWEFFTSFYTSPISTCGQTVGSAALRGTVVCSGP